MDKKVIDVRKKKPLQTLVFNFFFNIIINFKIGLIIYIIFNSIVNIQYFSLIIYIIFNNI